MDFIINICVLERIHTAGHLFQKLHPSIAKNETTEVLLQIRFAKRGQDCCSNLLSIFTRLILNNFTISYSFDNKVGTVVVLIGLTVMLVEYERVFEPFTKWLISDIPNDVIDTISESFSSMENRKSTRRNKIEKWVHIWASITTFLKKFVGERATLILPTVLQVLYLIPCILLYVGSVKVKMTAHFPIFFILK